MEEKGNAYTCLGTHTHKFTRTRKHKETRGSYSKGAQGCIEICMYTWIQA